MEANPPAGSHKVRRKLEGVKRHPTHQIAAQEQLRPSEAAEATGLGPCSLQRFAPAPHPMSPHARRKKKKVNDLLALAGNEDGGT